MKHIGIIILILLTLLCMGYGQQPKQSSVGKVTFSIGKYFIQDAGRLSWETAEFQAPVHNRDKIKTDKEARCEVTLSTKKVMRIGENSVVEITQPAKNENEVEVSKGRGWLSLFFPRGESSVRVKTPTSICAVRGTVFRLESDSNQTSYRCYQGELAVTPYNKGRTALADSTFKVTGGQELILVMDFETYKKQQEEAFRNFREDDMDAFERFKQQDQQQFNQMVENDLKAFKAMQDISYKASTFDMQEDNQSDWVRWNKERDRLLQNK
ncbi:MAG: hypothetical protein GF313_04775 [Caldithrix sp.]|nr:hypothetical protein [Caldithrix sp.]